MEIGIVLIAIVVLLGVVLVVRSSLAKRPAQQAAEQAVALIDAPAAVEAPVAPVVDLLPPVREPVAEPVVAPPAPAAPIAEPTSEPTVVPVVEPTPVVEAEVAPEPIAEPMVKAEPVQATLDMPEPVSGRFGRLRSRLSNAMGRGVLGMLGGASISEEDWEDIEATLLQADLGVTTTDTVMEALRKEHRGGGDVRAALRTVLLAALDVPASRELALTGDPSVVLVVGVNGTGKTTTTGKLARLLGALDHEVVLGAADTFRAAAADQLQTWGERSGAIVVRGPEAGDPASVAFDAVARAIEAQADVVLIDTAGRLHTKVGLMDELGKVKRVIEKQRPVNEVLLVLDATTGQNGLTQAAVFAEAVDITGVVLTKLDGTAKGGIVFAVQQTLGVPVKFVGLGEGVDDLAPFDATAFVEALIA